MGPIFPGQCRGWRSSDLRRGETGRRRREEETALAAKPTIAAAANKDTCPLGSCAGKQDGGELGWEGEAWGLYGSGGCWLEEIWADVSLLDGPLALGEGEGQG